MRSADRDGRRLSDADRELLAAAAGSAWLEGVEIPERHQQLAAAYLAGDIDEATYRERGRKMIVEEFGDAAPRRQ